MVSEKTRDMSGWRRHERRSSLQRAWRSGDGDGFDVGDRRSSRSLPTSAARDFHFPLKLGPATNVRRITALVLTVVLGCVTIASGS